MADHSVGREIKTNRIYSKCDIQNLTSYSHDLLRSFFENKEININTTIHIRVDDRNHSYSFEDFSNQWPPSSRFDACSIDIFVRKVGEHDIFVYLATEIRNNSVRLSVRSENLSILDPLLDRVLNSYDFDQAHTKTSFDSSPTKVLVQTTEDERRFLKTQGQETKKYTNRHLIITIIATALITILGVLVAKWLGA